MLGMGTNGYMQYQVAYLLLYPKFDCFTADSSGQFTVPVVDDFDKICVPSYFCSNDDTIAWSIDYSSDISLHNWMTSYDMICTDPYVIGLFGSCSSQEWLCLVRFYPVFPTNMVANGFLLLVWQSMQLSLASCFAFQMA